MGDHEILTERDDVVNLLDELKNDPKPKQLSSKQRATVLGRLKILGRQAEDESPIFTKNAIETLARHSFDDRSAQCSREALRCLANAMLMQPQTRQIFVDTGYATNVVDRLKNDQVDDEFLCCRIVFLLTYDTDLDFNQLLERHQLANSINQCIIRHAKAAGKRSKNASRSPMESLALSETLKLLFNLTHHYPAMSLHFTSSISVILKILHKEKPTPHPPLQPPVNHLINALINLDLENKTLNPLFPKLDPNCNVDHLINILNCAITEYPEPILDNVGAPVLTLIRRIHEFAPDSVKRFMQSLLLPTEDERRRPLGKSDTLAARLLQLSTSAHTPHLRDSISSLMFELSGRDAEQLIENVGYGFASGFLVSHNMPVPRSSFDSWRNVQGVDGRVGGDNATSNETLREVNYVTGQYLADEPEDKEPPMTEEEKGREAEKLFVLFDRLKKTGVMDLQNPIETALQSGRFEEVD